ncbi:hypothetical protein Scep_022336 [Stephania cephalantha]|uniref:PLAT domain-containing protein n=1 Tax=Stephania cephalantha TaxID=152367 RepID=A0AAP0I0W3_9MAGN
MAKLTAYLAFLIIFAAMLSTFQAQVTKYCEHEIVVGTGPSRGPTTKLKMLIEAIGGRNINTTNLIKNWGAMGPKHTYFLPNSLDKFRATLPCLPANFCYVQIGGKKGELVPHWFLNNITVETKGDGIYRIKSFNYFGDDGDVKSIYPYVDDGECP